MIEVEGLRHRFGARVAVDDLSFSLSAGQVTGFLGRNGAGKTTTMRALAGVLVPDHGRITIAGHVDPARSAAARAVTGYLSERASLVPELTVREQLTLLARLRGQPDEAVLAIAERLSLPSVLDRWVGTLSKGWRQRVALAAALVHGPRAVLLDEPMSGLDPSQRTHVRGVLADLAAQGCAVLLSSHVLAEIEDSCDRVLILHEGRLVADEQISPTAHDIQLQVLRPEGVPEALATLDRDLVVERDDATFWVRSNQDQRAAIAVALAPLGLVELRPARRLQRVWAQATGGDI
jgi:ABC-type multidrug transport system ATPase subunit